jgi:hypothetical protein
VPDKKKMTEDQILRFITQRARELKQPPAPLKGRMPKTTRHQSPRQRAAERMTENGTKAIYMDVFQAENAWKGIKGPDETKTTRNVGPKDNGSNYCHGKETGYRSTQNREPKG